MDFLLDTDDGSVYLGEINPRISGASPLTNLITSTYGGVPLFLFHLLEFTDVDWELDLKEIQSRWDDFDQWSQLVLKQTTDEIELITEAPSSGLWRMDEDGSVRFVRQEIDWHAVSRRQRGVLPAGLRRRRVPLPGRRRRGRRDPRSDADRRPGAARPGAAVGRGSGQGVPRGSAGVGRRAPGAAAVDQVVLGFLLG